MKKMIFLGMCVCLAACSAPQGKKFAVTSPGVSPGSSGSPAVRPPGLPPDIAVGPAEKMSTIGWADRGQTIALGLGKTLTVKLPSAGRNGYAWRFSEIPDPTVLKRVTNDSNEFIPNADPMKAGEQNLVFEGTGEGEVELKMWYGTLWASPMEEARIYTVAVAVSPEPAKPSKKGKSKKHATKV